jgi:hypothetical protein
MKWCVMIPELMNEAAISYGPLEMAHSSALSFIKWCPYPRQNFSCGHGSETGILVIAKPYTGRNCVSTI